MLPNKKTAARVNPAVLLVLVFGVTVTVILMVLILDQDSIVSVGSDGRDNDQTPSAIKVKEVVGEIISTGDEEDTGIAASEGALMGWVVDEGGSPVSNASVKAVRTKSLKASLKLSDYEIFETASSSDGRFFFDDLPTGTYSIHATRDSLGGHETAGISESGGGSNDIEIVMIAAGEVSGTVKKTDGVPVRAALVMSMQMRGSITSTDRNGRFTLEGISKGDHTIVATAAGFNPRTVKSVATGTTDLKIILFPPGYRPEKTPTANQGEVETAPHEIQPNRPPPARFQGRRDPNRDPKRPPGFGDPRDRRRVPPDSPPKKDDEQRR